MESGTPEYYLQKLKKIPRRQWWAFAGVWAAGLFAHGYMFANKLPNLDDIISLWAKGGTYISGRWALPLLGRLDGSFSSPWMLGLLSLLIFGIAAMVLVEILRLQSPLFCALAGALLIVFPTIICAFAYMFLSDAYALVTLLLFLAVRFCRRGLWGRLAAVGCITFAMGMYQAFFGLVPALLLYDLFLQSVDEKADLKKIVLTGLCDLGTMAGGMAVYLVVNRAACALHGIDPNFSGRLGAFSLGELPRYLFEAYDWFFYVWRDNANGNTQTPLLRLLMTCCEWLGILLVLLALARQLRRKKVLEAGLGALMMALFPLAVNVICLTGQTFIHTLMFYPMCLVPIVFLALCEDWNACREDGKSVRPHLVGRWVCAGLAALLVCRYAILANEAYLEMQINHSRRVAYWTTVVTLIRDTPGYNEWTPVVFVYEDGWDRSTPAQWNTDNLNDIVGVRLTYYTYADKQFLSNYLGFWGHYDYVNEEDYKQLPEVQEMPCYPETGSIRMIEGTVVVKF